MALAWSLVVAVAIAGWVEFLENHLRHGLFRLALGAFTNALATTLPFGLAGGVVFFRTALSLNEPRTWNWVWAKVKAALRPLGPGFSRSRTMVAA